MADSLDLNRLRQEYADRGKRFANSDIYSLFNPANLFIIQQRQRAVLYLLRNLNFYPLSERKILEIGCGAGGMLLEFLSYGASAVKLYGIDLLTERVKRAHFQLPHLPLAVADGQHLPFLGNTFDLVIQYTVFSSVLDEAVKSNLAQEMLRVLRKSGGVIVWYDFWLNPTNPQTRGIRPGEIRRLFPNCRFEFTRVTLAPPITRLLASHSWLACYILESLRIFNTHYLVAIRPK